MPRATRAPLIIAAAAALLGGGLLTVGILKRPVQVSANAPAPATRSASSQRPSGSPAPHCPTGPWDCAQQARFAAAKALIAKQSGHINVVIRDRQTGAVWRAGESNFRIWAGSTPKLAFAVALLEQDRAGEINLDATARSQIAAMLAVSDNTAAERLWNRYAHPSAMMTRFRDRYGMKTATYVNGFPTRWGFIKCTSTDLAALMSYILEKLNPTDRAYVVHAMRTVGSIQKWGVWAAGAALQPGVKDGWSQEMDGGHQHWITATVGFAGPDERYVVAAMYHQLPGNDTIAHGVHVLTDLIATIFGQPVPAPAVVPNRD